MYVFQLIWNIKGEGGWGDVLDKTTMKDYRGGTETPQGY